MSLFLVGGVPGESVAEAFDGFVAQAKRRGDRVAVVLLGDEEEAGSQLDAYAAPLTSRCPEVHIEPVWLLDDEDEGETSWPEYPEELAGIVVGGGFVPGYLDGVAPQRDLLARLLREGVPYLGFSAGAMIVSKHAIAGGWRDGDRQIAPEIAGEGRSELDIRDGLGLIGPTVDVHADTWTTLDRGVAALLRGPLTSAVAIDETACLVVDATSGRTSVLGTGRVAWLSRRGGEVTVRPQGAAPASESATE